MSLQTFIRNFSLTQKKSSGYSFDTNWALKGEVNHWEVNEKQVVGGTTCEKPSKVRRDEKGLKEKGWRWQRNERGKLILVSMTHVFLHGGSERVMLISHTGQKVVVFSNGFDFQQMVCKDYLKGIICTDCPKLKITCLEYGHIPSHSSLLYFWYWFLEKHSGSVRKHFLLTLFLLWFVSFNAAGFV